MKFHNQLFLSILLAALSLCSCSKRSELLDTLPAASEAAGMADVRKICADLDITLTDAGAEIPAEVSNHLNLGDDASGVLDLMARLDATGTADISSVAFAVWEGTSFLTLPIESWERLKEIDSPWLQWGEDSEGLHTGTLSRRISVVAGDSQIWLLEVNPKAAETVKKILKEAGRESIGKIDALAQALSDKKYVTMVGRSGAAEEKNEKPGHDALLEADWSVVSLSANGPRLVADVAMIKGTGEAVSVEGMQPVNPAVLSYVPSSCTLAVAAGLTPRFDWNFLNVLAMLADDFQVRAALGVALPYLNSIDGTVLFAAAPAGENAFTNPEPSDWNFILMAHLSQEKIDALMGTVRTMLFTSGLSGRTERDGVIVVPHQYGTDLYIGNVDGYFAVATFPFENNRNNSLTPIFEGKEAAASFSINSLSAISPDAPNWGVNLKAQFDGSKGQVELTLPGSEGNVLLNLLTLL